MNKRKNELVSIIIPTFNEEKNLRRCLESIKNQTHDNIEIIIVDQSSNDNTQSIAKEYTKKMVIREKPEFYSPPSKSRNMGFEKSLGDYIYNIDADMELPSTLIDDCLKAIVDQKSVALIIHERDIALNFWSECRALEKKCTIKDPYMEGARFISRQAFEKIKGYDSSLGSGEDWDLNARLKEVGKIGYSPTHIMHHIGKKNLFNNFKKMINYGKTFDKYIKKHPQLSKKQLTPFRTMYFRNWRLLLSHPVLTLGLFILKFSEFSGAFLGLVMKRDK